MMKKYLFYLLFITVTINVNSQSCEKIMKFVKSKSYGTTYSSYHSGAISKVIFYDINIDYKTHYFAIVSFKKGYSCNEYIYNVSSNTKLNYSLNYFDSAGKAFWKYIHLHNKKLKCAPKFD